MSEAHSKYSASNFEADALCPGRPVMQRGLPDSSSEYADEGTAAHTLLDWCLKQDKPALAFKGRRINVENRRTFEVTEEMAGYVQTTIGHVKALVGDGMLLSDQRVNYSAALRVDEREGWGTADVLGANGSTLIVVDFKYGRGVEVRAGNDEDGPNPQMACYGLGALAAIDDLFGPFDAVQMVISQPRISDEPSTYTLPVAALRAWADSKAVQAVTSRQVAEQTYVKGDTEWERTFLQPNDKSCKFCRAKSTCPALRAAATAPVLGHAVAAPSDFEVMPAKATVEQRLASVDEQWIAAALTKVDLIEDWCKALRAEAEGRLKSGAAVPGYKLVQGKRGNRKWASDEEATAALKAMRLKVEEMYDLKLISPTAAEKLAKAGTIGPRQWAALQKQITQAEGAMHVAPDADPRPAIAVRPVAGDFEVLTDAT